MKPIPDTPQAGVAIMASATLIAPLMDLFAKLLTESLSPGVIGFGRFAAQSVVLLPFVIGAKQWGRPTAMHVLAGFFLAGALI
jgi:hypothetical protein